MKYKDTRGNLTYMDQLKSQHAWTSDHYSIKNLVFSITYRRIKRATEIKYGWVITWMSDHMPSKVRDEITDP